MREIADESLSDRSEEISSNGRDGSLTREDLL